jgi:hypothetical protein
MRYGKSGVVVVCAGVVATVHHGSVCGQFDQGGVYCAQPIVEPAHGQHHDRPPINFIRVSTLTTGTSSSPVTIGPITWRLR